MAISSTDGLVGWWKLDESETPAADSSVNSNVGTWTGSPVHSDSVAPVNFTNSPLNEFLITLMIVLIWDRRRKLDDLGPLTISVWAYHRGYGENGLGYFMEKSDGYGNNGWAFRGVVTFGSVHFTKDYDTTDLKIEADGALTSSDF